MNSVQKQHDKLWDLVENFISKHSIKILDKCSDCGATIAWIDTITKDLCLVRNNFDKLSFEGQQFAIIHELAHYTGVILNRKSIIHYTKPQYRDYEECLANSVCLKLFSEFGISKVAHDFIHGSGLKSIELSNNKPKFQKMLKEIELAVSCLKAT